MKEYIEKETARAELIINDELYAADIVKAIPAADVVEVKCGKWLLDNGCAYCSACRNNFGKAIMSRANYCPHCGAKMDGGDRGG